MPSAVARAAALLALWVAIAGIDPAGLIVGVAAAAAASWCSVRLLPPSGGAFALPALTRLLARFPVQSITAGVDIARRAFDPKLPLRPGFVSYRTGFPPGAARSAFTTWVGLAPGTLPAGTDATGAVLVHCLDVGQPVAASLAAEEALLRQVFGGQVLGGQVLDGAPRGG